MWPLSASGVSKEQSITFHNAVVLRECIPYVLNEDVVPPFHQSNTSCVSNGVAEHDFLWKITDDVLTECLWNLECTIRVVGDYV
jgi:hypothetical protein